MEWFKVNGYNVVYGSLRLDPPIHQLVFLKLLAMASISRVAGTVCIASDVPYPDDVLAATLGVSVEELRTAIKHHQEQQQARIKINSWGGIEIQKWAEYQSKSYLRVRKHRESLRCNADVTDSNVDVTDRREENRIEKNTYSQEFEIFWSIYPKKVGKGAAYVSWQKLSPDLALRNKIKLAVECQKQSKDWLKDGGQFIPHPSTWLNQRRFDDTGLSLPQKPPPRKWVCVVCGKEAHSRESDGKSFCSDKCRYGGNFGKG
ncbi:MAG: phage replisome organizer N-terminal domain-containing protein [Patescibacteria group bacterium]